MFHRHKFNIHEHVVLDSKTTCPVYGLHMLGHLHKLFDLAVESVHKGSNGGKEGDFIDKKEVA